MKDELKKALIDIAEAAGKLNELDAAYMAGWASGAVAMAERKKAEKAK